MPRYSIPVWKMCVEALNALGGETSFIPLITIVNKVRELYTSENVNEGTIRHQVLCHCVNCHPGHDSYVEKGRYWREKKLFVSDGRGNYRFYSDQTDRDLYIRALEEDGLDPNEYTIHIPSPSNEPISSEEAEALAFIYIAQNIRSEGILQADCERFKHDGTLERLLERELVKDTAGLGHKLYLTTVQGTKTAKKIIRRRLDENRNELTRFLDSIPPKLCQFLLQEVFVYSARPQRAHPVAILPSSGYDDLNTNRHECLLFDKRVDTWRRKILDTLKKLILAEFVRYYVSTRRGELRDPMYCIPEDVVEFFEAYLADKDPQIVFTPELERYHRIYHFLYQLARMTEALNNEEELYPLLIEHDLNNQEFHQVISELLEENILRRDEDGLHSVNLTDEAIRKKYLYPIVRELIVKPKQSPPDVVPHVTEIEQMGTSQPKDLERKTLLVVVSDCKQKIWDRNPEAGPTKARAAFVGKFYKTNREYAEKFGDAWVILSTKDGFIAPDFLIPENYDVYPSIISVSELLKQSAEMHLVHFDRVEILAGPWDEHKAKARECFEHMEVRVHEPYAVLNDAREMIKKARRAIETGQPFTEIEPIFVRSEPLEFPDVKSEELPTPTGDLDVFQRGGAWVIEQGRLFYEFKVKVENPVATALVEVDVLLKYPETALKLLTDNPLRIPHVLPGRSQSLTFRLEPLDRCVGDFLEAIVIYYGGVEKTERRTVSLKPWEIEYKCNLLEPEPISREEFERRTALMGGRREQLMVPMSPEALRPILEKVVRECNLATVDQLQEQVEDLRRYFAIGKFDRNAVAMIVGLLEKRAGTEVVLKGLSEDVAKLPHLLKEVAQRITNEVKAHDRKVEAAHEELRQLLVEFKEDLRVVVEHISQDTRWTAEEVAQVRNHVAALEVSNLAYQQQLTELLEGGSRFDEVNRIMERLDQIETKMAEAATKQVRYEWGQLKQETTCKGKLKRFVNILRIGAKEGTKTLLSLLLKQVIPGL